MKITSPDTIKSSEKEFIDFINAELDWSAIEELILEKHHLRLQDEVIYKQGDIVVHDNQIAYRLDFDIKVSLSLIFNRQGDCLDIKTPDGNDLSEDDESAGIEDQKIPGRDALSHDDESGSDGNPDNWSAMASNIADMINDINQDS